MGLLKFFLVGFGVGFFMWQPCLEDSVYLSIRDYPVDDQLDDPVERVLQLVSCTIQPIILIFEHLFLFTEYFYIWLHQSPEL